MEAERNEAFKNDKVSEERLRVALDEHSKALSKVKSKSDTKVAELELQLKDITVNIGESE